MRMMRLRKRNRVATCQCWATTACSIQLLLLVQLTSAHTPPLLSCSIQLVREMTLTSGRISMHWQLRMRHLSHASSWYFFNPCSYIGFPWYFVYSCSYIGFPKLATGILSSLAPMLVFLNWYFVYPCSYIGFHKLVFCLRLLLYCFS